MARFGFVRIACCFLFYLSMFVPSCLGAPRPFRELVQDCQVAERLVTTHATTYNVEAAEQMWRCMSFVEGLITVMQMNCLQRKQSPHSAPKNLSIRPTNVAQGINALLEHARKRPQEMDEPEAPAAMLALVLERRCEY